MHHGPIPEASTGMDIGCVQQRLHLGHRKIMDQRLISFLLGDRQHPAAVFEARRDAIFDEALKALMAARRVLRVLGPLPRWVSRCARKSITSWASRCSRHRSEGVRASRALAKANSNCKV